jgi:hypothetical protein
VDPDSVCVIDELQTCKSITSQASAVIAARDRAVSEQGSALSDMSKLQSTALAELSRQHSAAMLDLSKQHSNSLADLSKQLEASGVQMSELQSRMLASQQVFMCGLCCEPLPPHSLLGVCLYLQRSDELNSSLAAALAEASALRSAAVLSAARISELELALASAERVRALSCYVDVAVLFYLLSLQAAKSSTGDSEQLKADLVEVHQRRGQLALDVERLEQQLAEVQSKHASISATLVQVHWVVCFPAACACKV